jgi:peroxiredoxin
MRHRLSILIVETIAAATLAACAAHSPQREATRPEERVPNTLVSTLDGKPTGLAAFLHGRPALVSLWATWCEACLEERGALNRLGAQASASGGLVVGVAVGEPLETVLAFTRRHRFDYAQLVDENFELADTLGEHRIPSTLVVDGEGRIVFHGATFGRDALAAFRRVSTCSGCR